MAKKSRRECAQQIADWVGENGLTQPVGGDVGHSVQNGVNVHYVSFSKPRVLDGVVYLYGPEWIQVKSDGPMAAPWRVFASPEAAIEYMDKAFVQLDMEAAMQVPDRYTGKGG